MLIQGIIHQLPDHIKLRKRCNNQGHFYGPFTFALLLIHQVKVLPEVTHY